MKLKLLIIGLALLVSALPSYAGGIIMMGGGVASAPSSTYVGWPNSGGTPTGTPTSQAGSSDDIIATKWIATESGTAKSIQAYITDVPATVDYDAVVLYRDISGTKTLVGTGNFTGADATWTGKVTLTAVDGQSLDFSTSDELYFGVCGSGNASYYVGRNDDGGTGMSYVFGSDYSAGPPATITFSTSDNRLVGVILEYE